MYPFFRGLENSGLTRLRSLAPLTRGLFPLTLYLHASAGLCVTIAIIEGKFRGVARRQPGPHICTGKLAREVNELSEFLVTHPIAESLSSIQGLFVAGHALRSIRLWTFISASM